MLEGAEQRGEWYKINTTETAGDKRARERIRSLDAV